MNPATKKPAVGSLILWTTVGSCLEKAYKKDHWLIAAGWQAETLNWISYTKRQQKIRKSHQRSFKKYYFDFHDLQKKNYSSRDTIPIKGDHWLIVAGREREGEPADAAPPRLPRRLGDGHRDGPPTQARHPTGSRPGQGQGRHLSIVLYAVFVADPHWFQSGSRVFTSVMDPDSLNPDTDPDPAFQVNPDRVSDPRFLWPKIEEKNIVEKKLQFTYP